jgi:2-oxoglutarate ferredoxin oxidoreductase subunit alpha
MIRPISLWPFPYDAIKQAAQTIKSFLVFEMSMGQMVEDVQFAVEGGADVEFYGRPGGVIPTPSEFARVISRNYVQKGLK